MILLPNLVLLRPWEYGKSPTDYDFSTESFWIHIHGVPRVSCTLEVGARLACSFVDSQEVQIREIMGNGKRFFRIRVTVNLDVPLRRCIRLRSPLSGEITASITYERLPTFCHCCGIIGHRVKDCPSMNDQEADSYQLQFGSWLAVNDTLRSFVIIRHLDPLSLASKPHGAMAAARVQQDGARTISGGSQRSVQSPDGSKGNVNTDDATRVSGTRISDTRVSDNPRVSNTPNGGVISEKVSKNAGSLSLQGKDSKRLTCDLKKVKFWSKRKSI